MIADYKNPFSTSGPVSNWTYLANVKNISNTYPYGKSYGTNAIYNAVDDYRYGFNGMEKEKNINSSGNTFDFGARVYDSEFPTFLSRDPKEQAYSGLSPFQYSNNNPIAYIDFNGEHFGYYIDKSAKSPTVIISMNVYTVTERTEREALKAAKLWNDTKFEVDGYKVIFNINVIRPEELLSSDENDLIIGDLWKRVSTDDPIANIYAGTDTRRSKFITPSDEKNKKFVGGETMNGEYVYMNTHYKYGNMGKNEKEVGHEFGHLLGLDDNKEGANTYYPKGKSIMEYKDYLSLPTESDVETIIQYIIDYENGQTTEQDAVKVTRTGEEKLDD